MRHTNLLLDFSDLFAKTPGFAGFHVNGIRKYPIKFSKPVERIYRSHFRQINFMEHILSTQIIFLILSFHTFRQNISTGIVRYEAIIRYTVITLNLIGTVAALVVKQRGARLRLNNADAFQRMPTQMLKAVGCGAHRRALCEHRHPPNPFASLWVFIMKLALYGLYAVCAANVVSPSRISFLLGVCIMFFFMTINGSLSFTETFALLCALNAAFVAKVFLTVRGWSRAELGPVAAAAACQIARDIPALHHISLMRAMSVPIAVLAQLLFCTAQALNMFMSWQQRVTWFSNLQMALHSIDTHKLLLRSMPPMYLNNWIELLERGRGGASALRSPPSSSSTSLYSVTDISGPSRDFKHLRDASCASVTPPGGAVQKRSHGLNLAANNEFGICLFLKLELPGLSCDDRVDFVRDWFGTLDLLASLFGVQKLKTCDFTFIATHFLSFAEKRDLLSWCGAFGSHFESLEAAFRFALFRQDTPGQQPLALKSIRRGAIKLIIFSFLAQELLACLASVRGGLEHQQPQLKVGGHIGNISCGVIGQDKLIFDIFGSTVNAAARLSAAAEPPFIYVSKTIWTLAHSHLRGLVRLISVDSRSYKGLSQPISTVSLTSEKNVRATPRLGTVFTNTPPRRLQDPVLFLHQRPFLNKLVIYILSSHAPEPPLVFMEICEFITYHSKSKSIRTAQVMNDMIIGASFTLNVRKSIESQQHMRCYQPPENLAEAVVFSPSDSLCDEEETLSGPSLSSHMSGQLRSPRFSRSSSLKKLSSSQSTNLLSKFINGRKGSDRGSGADLPPGMPAERNSEAMPPFNSEKSWDLDEFLSHSVTAEMRSVTYTKPSLSHSTSVQTVTACQSDTDTAPSSSSKIWIDAGNPGLEPIQSEESQFLQEELQDVGAPGMISPTYRKSTWSMSPRDNSDFSFSSEGKSTPGMSWIEELVVCAPKPNTHGAQGPALSESTDFSFTDMRRTLSEGARSLGAKEVPLPPSSRVTWNKRPAKLRVYADKADDTLRRRNSLSRWLFNMFEKTLSLFSRLGVGFQDSEMALRHAFVSSFSVIQFPDIVSALLPVFLLIAARVSGISGEASYQHAKVMFGIFEGLNVLDLTLKITIVHVYRRYRRICAERGAKTAYARRLFERLFTLVLSNFYVRPILAMLEYAGFCVMCSLTFAAWDSKDFAVLDVMGLMDNEIEIIANILLFTFGFLKLSPISLPLFSSFVAAPLFAVACTLSFLLEPGILFAQVWLLLYQAPIFMYVRDHSRNVSDMGLIESFFTESVDLFSKLFPRSVIHLAFARIFAEYSHLAGCDDHARGDNNGDGSGEDAEETCGAVHMQRLSEPALLKRARAVFSAIIKDDVVHVPLIVFFDPALTPARCEAAPERSVERIAQLLRARCALLNTCNDGSSGVTTWVRAAAVYAALDALPLRLHVLREPLPNLLPLLRHTAHDVSVLHVDIVDFTATCARMHAREIVSALSELFRAFDRRCARHGLEKVKTVGDAYQAVCGLVHTRAPIEGVAVRAARCALALQATAARVALPRRAPFRVRVGVATGSARGQIVGLQRARYDVFGAAAARAESLEAAAAPGDVCVDAATAALLLAPPQPPCSRHEFSVVPFPHNPQIFVLSAAAPLP
eukprot:gnl/Chilomastix_cuspidata/1177.p1 GENE.gnl/Chilomastix_cuspidata/1177~~gnl/Chilomastix_cuspidata/1177.p1  ORF type:complete len:1619 (-),score=435.06 gnl/Chilomastix_cuspidata/1177:485-5341(-)